MVLRSINTSWLPRCPMLGSQLETCRHQHKEMGHKQPVEKFLPFGNQTWLAGKPHVNGDLNGKISHVYGGFSSQPCWINGGQSNVWRENLQIHTDTIFYGTLIDLVLKHMVVSSGSLKATQLNATFLHQTQVVSFRSAAGSPKNLLQIPLDHHSCWFNSHYNLHGIATCDINS